MITQVTGIVTFGMLAVIALAGLVDAGAALVKITRHNAQPGGSEWFGSRIFLLRMLPRPNAIFLGVMVLSMLDFLFCRWIPLAWLAVACLLMVFVYSELDKVVRWAYGDTRADKGHEAAEGQSSAPSQPDVSAPGGAFMAWAAREPSLSPDQYGPAGSSSAAQRLPVPETTKLRSNSDFKSLGVVICLGAGLAGFIFIYLPISEALKGAQQISYYREAIAFIPLAMIVGLVFVVFGEKGWALMQKRPKGLLLVLYIVIILIYMFGCMGITNFVMHSIGYE